MINIKLPDGKIVELENGAGGFALARLISRDLLKKAVAVEADGVLKDMSAPLMDGATVVILTEKDGKALEILRHSAAHLMAQAVRKLYPKARVTIGPVIEDGFYYDFDYENTFTPEDLEKIEKEMAALAIQDLPLVRSELTAADAASQFSALGEKYKAEIINDLGADTVSLYTQGEFTDLCRGPHVPSTGFIKHFKLLSVAGAYWRGNEKNQMLQRVYGTAFFSKKELEDYLKLLEEAKKRDHRRLGKELKLFMFDDAIGAGFPIYLPKGGVLRATLEEFERKEHLKRGYQIVYGPTLLKRDMWVHSGHVENYGENMYFTEVDGVAFGIKPMNCVSHIIIYSSELRSYRDLPIRFFELGTVHRHEKSGALHGLMRVRAFTQDDAHIFCREDQVEAEAGAILDFVRDLMDLLGFEFTHTVSTRPEKSIGSDENWELATKALIATCEKKGIKYTLNEGDGAFYGPKIDIKLKDAIGRFWQCATIQCDFNLPERFDMSYIGTDGAKHRPVMLHRTVFGSIDRFLGVLTEHFAGAFPLWLAPVQVRVMNITDAQAAYAEEVTGKLTALGIRAEADTRGEKIGFKIREAQVQKIPHMLILGEEERSTGKVTVRLRSGESKNNLDFSEYVDILLTLIDSKSLEIYK